MPGSKVERYPEKDVDYLSTWITKGKDNKKASFREEDLLVAQKKGLLKGRTQVRRPPYFGECKLCEHPDVTQSLALASRLASPIG